MGICHNCCLYQRSVRGFDLTPAEPDVLSSHADKTGERFWHVAGSLLAGMVGMIISLSTMNTAARYIALFLQAQSYAGFIVFYSWISNTFPRPPMKRAVALALINAFSQLGNIAGSYVSCLIAVYHSGADSFFQVWPKTYGPTYRNSYGITISCFGFVWLYLS